MATLAKPTATLAKPTATLAQQMRLRQPPRCKCSPMRRRITRAWSEGLHATLTDPLEDGLDPGSELPFYLEDFHT
jgi:hypothetical protein